MKTVYFDFDGTLICVNHRYQRILEHYIGAAHKPVSQYTALKRARIQDYKIAQQLYKKEINALDEYLDFKHNKLEQIDYLLMDTVIPKTQEACELFKQQGYDLAIITQRRCEENFLYQLKILNLDKIFAKTFVVSPEKGDRGKELALKDIVSQQDIIIGDSPIEQQCAQRLGIEGYFVQTGLWSATAASVKRNIFANCFEVANYVMEKQ